LENNLKVILPDGSKVKVVPKESLAIIGRDFQQYYPSPIVAAKFNHQLRELNFQPETDGEIIFLDLHHPEGMRIYQRSLAFLLITAAKELFPAALLSIEHSLGKGLYCELNKDTMLTEDEVQDLEEKMKELVGLDLPITKEQWPLEKAISYFEKENLTDKAQLLKYRDKDYLNMYGLRSTKDYLYGYLVPATGCLKVFSLRYHMPGLELRFPDEKYPNQLASYEERPKLFTIFREAEEWGKILDVRTAGTLNDYITAGRGRELLQLNEALHEKKIAQIADAVTNRKNQVRVILVAGPSSSGKTTFAGRLAIQLRVNGLKPISISLDDYFVDREFTPKDSNGQWDFEALEAIDLRLFNKQLSAIIQGKEVNLPSYNFKSGQREFPGRKVQIGPDQPIIIEGIHGLNERLTASIPRDRKFKIYISAITSLNIDRHNRIPTTDTRILRRLVRDHRSRGNDATKTIKMWPMVRRGEEKNIFPYQEEADIMFNSALVYELAILKKHAEPLLKTVDCSLPEYITAKRLLGFLECFVPLTDVEIPGNSILKEFVGGSCLTNE